MKKIRNIPSIGLLGIVILALSNRNINECIDDVHLLKNDIPDTMITCRSHRVIT